MKCIVLLSGGLDSSLALKMMSDMGLEVLALHFSSPFCRCDGSKGCGSSAKSVSDLVGVELRNVYLGDAYLEVVKDPKHGYGKNVNPCIDCRIQKFIYAKNVMLEEGASFIVTGEVLGQRPMSQKKYAMSLIEKESGLEGLILRPLSAKVMEPTIPEKEGWVDRKTLLDFQGRSRKPQIKLAEELGINDYPCPAGGCLLTDPNFAGRVRDLFEYGEWDGNNVELIKLGRHFRLNKTFKLIVGRDEQENNRLLSLALEKDTIFDPGELKGPTGLGRGEAGAETIVLAAQIMAGYIVSDGDETEVIVKRNRGLEEEIVSAKNITESKLREYMI